MVCVHKNSIVLEFPSGVFNYTITNPNAEVYRASLGLVHPCKREVTINADFECINKWCTDERCELELKSDDSDSTILRMRIIEEDGARHLEGLDCVYPLFPDVELGEVINTRDFLKDAEFGAVDAAIV